jgi:hypothetical protein
MTTETFSETRSVAEWFPVVFREPHSEREHRVLQQFRALGCVQVARPISTSQLRTLRCFHFWPINPVV